MNKIDPKNIWEGFHWSFFVNIQGLIISMSRFEQYIALEDIKLARVELETISTLMFAAAASMELAGSFSSEEYENTIRPSMLPPNVNSEGLSGLYMWEHLYFIKVWKRNRNIFHNIPKSLKLEHNNFISAYMALSKSHKKVCSNFGGENSSSLLIDNSNAVETLSKFERNRMKLISRNQST